MPAEFGWHCGDSGTGVVSRWRDDGRARESRLRSNGFTQRAEMRAGFDDFRQHVWGKPESFEHFLGPRPFGRMKELRRGCVRKLDALRSCEAPIEPIRNHQKRVRGGE